MLAQQRGTRLADTHEIDERMPDEFHGHAFPSIQLLFERKDHQHPADEPLHRLHAAGAPRPELRADVVDHRNAETMERCHQAEVEVGKVDRDEDVRPSLACDAGQAPQHRERSRQHADRFRQPCDRDALEVANEPDTRRCETLTAEAEDVGGRIAAKDLGGQRSGVQITGRLAARDHDAHRWGLTGAAARTA